MNAFLVFSAAFLLAIFAFYFWAADKIGRSDSGGDPVPAAFTIGASN